MSGASSAVPAGRQRQLVVLARWPVPGRCKRRLAAGIGAAPAARVQARLTGHTLETVREARRLLPFDVVLAVSPLGRRAAARWARRFDLPRAVIQGPGELGTRMQRQLARARREGARQVVLVGSDLPHLAAADLLAAFAALEQRPLVLGPAADGGYWLIGLRLGARQGSGPGPAPLFSGIAWGTAQVLEQTRAAAARIGLPLALLAERADLDRPADLRPWR